MQRSLGPVMPGADCHNNAACDVVLGMAVFFSVLSNAPSSTRVEHHGCYSADLAHPELNRSYAMQAVLLAVVLLAALPSVIQADERDAARELQTCKARQAELLQKVEQFTGEARMKRLMEADLRRASREEAEGDGDECNEALDHAAKLLAGDT